MTETIEQPVSLICKFHGEYTGEKISFKGFEINPTCPVCDKEIRERMQQQIAENEKQRVINEYRSMNIGKKFHDATFDNFNASNFFWIDRI